MARIEDFEPLSEAEKKLLRELSSGEVVVIGDGELPSEAPDPTREIRGAFLREVILDALDGLKVNKGYGARAQEKGVQLKGALVTGALKLESARVHRDVVLEHCRFTDKPVFRSACFDNLELSGSAFPGLDAERLEARGSVFLRVVKATGEVSFIGATLGSLDCGGAELDGSGVGAAFLAQHLDVKGSVFLRRIETDGNVDFSYARIGGVIDTCNAKLVSPGGKAIALQGANIAGELVMLNLQKVVGEVDLTAATLGGLIDDESSWPATGHLILNNCRYGGFPGGVTPVDAQSRIKWLMLQDPERSGADFWPQPWEQCARVLREMGHREDSRKVLIAKEKRQRSAVRLRAWKAHRVGPVAVGTLGGVVGGLAVARLFGVVAGGGVFLALALFIGLDWWRGTKDFIFAVTVRYGHVPLLAFAWLFGLWVLGALVFQGVAQNEALKPNSSRMFRAAEWVDCAPGRDLNTGTSQLACFLDQPEAKSYPAFSPLIYSADTLLPIVDLEMQGYWIPDDQLEPWGAMGRYYLWFQIFMGWALSLLAVAGFSGLIRTDSK